MKRLWSRALVLGVAALAVASVSIDCGRTFVVSNMGGTPITGAYVAYHHEGRTYGIAESVSYQASQLALLKSDAKGSVVVPPAVHVHWPIIQTGADLTIDLIYAPTRARRPRVGEPPDGRLTSARVRGHHGTRHGSPRRRFRRSVAVARDARQSQQPSESSDIAADHRRKHSQIDRRAGRSFPR